MKKLPFCLVYSRQPGLIQKARGFLHSFAEIVSLSESQQLFVSLQQHDPVVLIFDVLTPESDLVLRKIREEWPLTLVIVLGEDRTAPILSAQKEGVFATESADCPRQRFQNLAQIALRHLEVIQENESMRTELNCKTHAGDSTKSSSNQDLLERATVHEALRSFTQFHDLDTLLGRSLDWLKNYKALGSIGIFLQEIPGGTYSLKSSLKCPKEISSLSFDQNDPLVAWFHSHATVLSQQGISKLADQTTQRHLNKALRAFFAEAIFPLHGSEGLLGWIFVGSGTTGRSLTPKDVIELNTIMDYLTFVIEKCIFQQRNEAQRLHFESILQALSSGIILFNKEMKIIWLNFSASTIFQTVPAKITGKPPEILGTQLADFIYRSSIHPFEHSTMCWSPAQSQHKFLVDVHPCVKNGVFERGFMLLQDITSEILLQENDRKIQRAEVATKLAADLSTEIRNPLVAIKAFVQLLPERYEDLPFRRSFIDLVSHEVERLNALSSGIQNVILSKDDGIHHLDLRDVLRESIHVAVMRSGLQDGQIQTVIDSQPALLLGDPKALTECFTQMISAMIGSCRKDPAPAISIAVSVRKNENRHSYCTITLEGKSSDVGQSELFNFPNTQWLDIDLNVTKRTIMSHRGQLRIGDDGKTDCITVELPLES